MPDPLTNQLLQRAADPMQALSKAQTIGDANPSQSQITLGEMPLAPGDLLANVGSLRRAPGEAISEVWNMLHNEPSPVDPLKVFSLERLTNRNPGLASALRVPKGFELPPEFDPTTVGSFSGAEFGRSPLTTLRSKIWQKFTPKPSLIDTSKGRSGAAMIMNRPTKLTEDIVRDIRQLKANGVSANDIYNKYPTINKSTLQSALGNQTWNHVK